MKQIFYSVLLSLLMSMAANVALAYDAEIDGIYYNFNGTEATVTSGDNKYTGDIVIPESVTYNETEYSVVQIGNRAFFRCIGLTSVTIGNGVMIIGEYAFSGCSSLTSVSIPNSVTSIRYWAFQSCTSLTSIVIPNSVTYLTTYVFEGCSGLSSITVDGNNTSYASEDGVLFNKDKTILIKYPQAKSGTVYIIPNTVRDIERSAFEGCTALASVTIPNSVTSIGWGVFYGCSVLSSITVDDNNVSYTSEDGVLFNKDKTILVKYPQAKSETAYVIPNTVTTIGDRAFSKGSGLISVMIPNSVTSIETYAFWGCSGLSSIIIPNSVTSIGSYAFEDCIGLTSVTIPNSMTSIEIGVFYGCNNLTSATIPSSITNIGWGVFYNCYNLTSITIPTNVTSIGGSAFRGCSSLTDIYCYAKTIPTTDSDAFPNILSNITLHVPAASIETYNTTAPWNDFKEIVESDYLNVDELNIKAGESNTQEISLNSGLTNLVGFQMDLTLPEGVGIDKTGCTLSPRITDLNQQLTIGKLESGAYRITSTSLSLIPISGNDGTLLSLKLTAEDGCIGGKATISNIIFSTSESEKVVMSDKTFDISVLYDLTYKVDGQEYKDTSVVYGTALTPEDEPTMEGYTFGGWSEIPETMPSHDVEITGNFYQYGDVNTDEAVDVVDVVDIARFVVATPSVNFREKLADLNFDKTVNIADAVTLVNYIAGDQDFARAMTSKSYDYDQCQLQLLSDGANVLSFCLDGDADFTAFQFEVELPESTDITAMRINGQRTGNHKLLYNKVGGNHYRVAVLSLSNTVFKGSEGELLNISIDGLNTNEVNIDDIHFVTKNGTDITFDALSLSGIVTGIANVRANKGNDVIFDLHGRKLSKVQRSINIVNGRKVFVNK